MKVVPFNTGTKGGISDSAWLIMISFYIAHISITRMLTPLVWYQQKSKFCFILYYHCKQIHGGDFVKALLLDW
jgi:hypothetical protein